MPSEPTLQHQAGVFQLTWRDEHIEIRVDRVHVEKAGVYGEILIRTTAPGYQPHVHGPVHFNMISTTARNQLMKHLTDVLPLDWSGILEQTCYTVVEEHRAGEPPINIASHAPADALGMRVAPIIQERQPTLLYGEGDSLKSFFATFISVITRVGRVSAGLTPEPGNVLYLDYETDIDTFWERVNLITAGMDEAPPDGLLYRPMVQSLVDEFPRINKICMENEIGLVVVDSAAPATLEPEKAEYVIPFFRALRALNTTSLVIAHMTKAAKGDYPFGSTMWRNLPRANFQVKADRNQDDVAISLRHTKANNGRRLDPLGFKFAFGPDSLIISKAEASQYTDLSQDVGLTQRIKQVLNRGLMGVQDIIEEINSLEGESKTTAVNIRSTLSQGMKRGHFQNMQGQWGNAVNVNNH